MLDRVRHGTIPDSARARCHGPAGGDARGEPRRQAGRVAGVSRAASSDAAGDDPKALVLAAHRARLDGEVADELIDSLLPRPGAILLVAVARSIWPSAIPSIRCIPIRLIGTLLRGSRRGCGASAPTATAAASLLFVAARGGLRWPSVAAIVAGAAALSRRLGWLAHAFFVYSFLALGDLLRHVWRVEQALVGGDLDAARERIARWSAATSIAWTPPPAGARRSRASART